MMIARRLRVVVGRGFASRPVILLKDFTIKGKEEPAGSIVSVTRGYMRNYLLPRNIAVAATPRNRAYYAKVEAAEGEAAEPRNVTVIPVARQPYSIEENVQKFHETINPPPRKRIKDEHGFIDGTGGFPFKGPFRKGRKEF